MLRGCPKGTVDKTCVSNSAVKTIYTNDVKEWRHAAYDNTNKILYFCDYSMKKKRLVCFSTSDGNTFKSKLDGILVETFKTYFLEAL